MKVMVIGAGAAGYFSAIHRKINVPTDEVILVEKSDRGLGKVKVSGGGRCNVTHACFDARQLSEYYPRGGKALIGPFQRFQPRDTIQWFEDRGVPLKIEADGRVFPVSNSSQSIIDALETEASGRGVDTWTRTDVQRIETHPAGGFSVHITPDFITHCDRIILATGSSRMGYSFAKSLGHTILDPVPSLFTFKINDDALTEIPGVAVSDAVVTVSGTRQWKQRGPVLVTHWGFSGPATLKISAWAARDFAGSQYSLPLTINWLPNYRLDDVEAAITDRQMESKQWVRSRPLVSEIPGRLWNYLVTKALGIGDLPWNETGKRHRGALVEVLTRDRYMISGKGVFKDEFVTCGGVALNEVDFRTMESKRCPGLYFAGEILDIDGVTGGFNFQNAWTTAYIAASDAPK
ncbi:NAD(P)/FAD-dependent oxidoreductase [bacterium]|nr:NAD(P)/FAD-dependent oxidoreductase [bacterium]